MRLGQALSALLLTFALSLSIAGAANAVQPDEVLPDPALEARARAISEGLRCLVCQNQSIDDLEAPLAKDLRLLVRERLKAGDSDQEIVDFIVARYGEFVLLKPRFEFANLAALARHAGCVSRCDSARRLGLSAPEIGPRTNGSAVR